MGDWAGDPYTGWAAQLHRDSFKKPKKPRPKKVCPICGHTANRKNMREHLKRHNEGK